MAGRSQGAARWPELTKTPAKSSPRQGRQTADGFAKLCRERASEATIDASKGSFVAANGTILEQSQILTTHDLAGLTAGLGLHDTLRGLAPSLAMRCFEWIVRRQQQHAPAFRARLQMIKNSAYAWRQALFFLSLCDEGTQHQALAGLQALVAQQPRAWAERFAPVVSGLRLVLEGGRFDADGFGRGDRGARRLLGWSVGPHWLLARGG